VPLRSIARGLAAALVLAVALALPARAAPDVTWSFTDDVAACPAGDSVAAGHPARLRVVLTYRQAPGGVPAPRAGAPPESIWVAWSAGGGVTVNDQPGRAFADDSTDATGTTRVTLPSLSGCGTLAFSLYVAGELAGSGVATIRSADADADGSVGAESPCDLDFDGAVTTADLALRDAHATHSHRHAVFGTLVRRTNLCQDCGEDAPNTLGESSVSWSPDGRRIAFTIHLPPDGRCAAFLVPSDPAEGDGLVQFTFPDTGIHDYDPAWSPRGDEIAFGRADNTIWVKGVPGLAADTSLRLVTEHHDGTSRDRGDLTPAWSPDGEWIAFSRKNAPAEHWQLWKTPSNGDTTRRVQLTSDAGGDAFYPQWSTDGAWILYERLTTGGVGVWKVPAAGGTPVAVLLPGADLSASTPTFSPDGAVILAGIGPAIDAEAHALAASLEGLTLPTPRAAPIAPGFSVASGFPVLSPRLSSDGTRLALRTLDLWAARRNMSRPPRIVSVAGIAPDEARPVITLHAAAEHPSSFTVAAADPEGDAIDLAAHFLRDGMSFDPGTGTFSWTPPAALAGTRAVVRFQATTPSGGSAYALAVIEVGAATGVGAPGAPASFRLEPARPNPSAGSVAVAYANPRGGALTAEVFDVRGRRVRVLARALRAAGAGVLAWDGRDARGREAPAGIYWLRVRAGEERAERKVVRLSR